MSKTEISRRKAIAGGTATAAGLLVRQLWPEPVHDEEAVMNGARFVVDGDRFLLDGQPFQVIAGEMHYARIPREYWTHRIRMAKAMGLNTVATYVFWNVHEPQPGRYDFSGNYDVAEFIRAVQVEGMHVLLRAGPYSCAEWEFGGFPAWLLKDPKNGAALRTTEPGFIVPAERWLKRLAEETAPLLLANGGPILAVQLENEYENFSNDPRYMQEMLRIFRETGWKDSMLYTVDPSKALKNGCLDGIPAGVNFGTGNAEPALAALAAMRPGAPLFATEYWPGWFDLWGHPHETRPVGPQLKDIEYVLSHKGSINIYMFHGGTSFGMMAGASASTGNYRGNVTSYDYDAPLDEAGHTTPKFFAYRDLILKYSGGKALPVPETARVVAIPEFEVSAMVPTDPDQIIGSTPRPIHSETPQTMEQIDQAYGYILYSTFLPDAVSDAPLVIDPVHDFAQLYLSGKLVGMLDRHYNQTTVMLTGRKGASLAVLIENTGRLNSTKHMREEWKGMRSVTLAGKPLTGWRNTAMSMDKAPTGVLASEYPRHPADPPGAREGKNGLHYAMGHFRLEELGDAFLDVSQLGKGLIWINGHALGRFWNVGPQQTLYVPAPWLKKGENEVVIFDMFPVTKKQTLVGRLKPILDGPTPGYENDPERKKKAAADAEFGPAPVKPAVP